MEVSERWLAFLRDEGLDRVPVFPTTGGHSAKVMGAPNLGDYYSKPKFNIKAQDVARELYGYDQPPLLLDPGYNCEIWGGKTILPYNPKMGAPTPVQPGVLSSEDLEKKELPDPRTGPWMKELREMMRLATEKNQMPYVWIPGGYITSAAPMIVSLEEFMIWLVEEPDLAHKALSLGTEFGISLAETYVDDFGSDSWYVFEPNPTDSNVLIDANMFEQYPLKHAMKLNKRLIDMGVSIWIHWCADHNANIDAGHVSSIPVGKEGIINFGPEVTMERQVKELSDKFRITGNINPPLMMTETFDEWQETCAKNIEEGKQAKKGYALGVGCEVPPPAPPSSVYGLTVASKRFGAI